jgi:hypothetical protein
MTGFVLEQAFGSGVFTTADASVLGVSQRRLALAAGRGELVRLGPGVYRLSGTLPEPRLDYLDRVDAVVLRHRGAALAGVSAAAAWELPCPDKWGDWRTLPITLWSPKPINSRPGIVRLKGAHGRAFATVSERLVTDLVTTAVDVAWQLPSPEALIVLDAVARRLAGTTERHALRSPKLAQRVRAEMLAPLSEQPRRPGTTRIVRSLTWANPAADSPPESYIRGHILSAGKRAPSVNPPLTGASGKTYWVDLYWPDSGLAIEIDGKIKYRDPGVLYREKLRHDDLRAAGIDPVRWPAEDVFAFAPLLVGDLP